MSFSGPLVPRHKKGWTVAAYDVSGEHIISGGVDGKVKVSNTINDQSPMEHVIGEKINAIVCRNDTIVLATEGTHVHMIQIEDGLPDGIATRFTAEVMDIASNRDRTKLVCCSSDFMIKVVNLSNADDREFVLGGHQAPVLSVAFDPLDIFVASSSCDGTVRVWRLDQRKEVKCIRSLSQCNDPTLALSYCRLCWASVSGKFLAVPIDREICLYERDSWEVLSYLTCPSITKPIVVCSSSFDGSRLAAGCMDGWTIVWSVEERHVLHRIKDASESPICSLCWHPHQENSLLVSNRNGFLGLIRLPETKNNTDGILSPRSLNALMGCDEDGDTDELLQAAAAQAESSRLMDDDEAVRKIAAAATNSDDDDDVQSIDLSRIKSGFMTLEDGEDAADQAGLGIGEQALNTIATAKIEAGAKTVVDPPGPVQAPVRIQKAFQPGSMPLGFRERFMVWNRFGLVIQYRSNDDDQDEQDETDRSSLGSIEVEFHDTSMHHSLRLSNNVGYTMADLSLTALLLASPGVNDPSLSDDADAGEPMDASDISQIAVLPLDTGKAGGGDSSSSEWTIKLPPGEACEAVCLVPNTSRDLEQSERGYAVVATSRRFLRIFAQPSPSAALLRPSTSLHLFQITKLGLPPVSFPGCGVVAMASHPSQPILGMVVTAATGELMWRLYYLGGVVLGSGRSRQPAWLTGSLTTWQPLPLSPSVLGSSDRATSASLVKLTWFGFSEMGGLYTHDACGVVRRLLHGRRSPNCDYHWIPVCDTRAVLKPANRRSDTYFIVGVLESTEPMATSLVADQLRARADAETAGMGQLQAIYCKASKWPRVFPRPVICSLPFHLPLCSMDTDQGNLEDNYLRYLVSEDWPTWGPNPKSPISIMDAAESDMSELFQTVSSKCSTKRKGVLLRLFALAAKLESDWASLAIARLMPDAATVQLAIRYAGRLRRQHLAHRLAGIALDKERGVNGAVGEDNEESSSAEEDAIRDDDHNRRTMAWSLSTRTGLSGTTGSKPYRRPSGPQDDDVADVSLVSSATDDTQEEGHISGLPLPDSEPITQSFLSNNTPSSAARNPFRDSLPNRAGADGTPRTESKVRARGSEVLDSWKPAAADSTPTSSAASKSSKKQTQQPNKKRTAPISVEKRRSKILKSSSTSQNSSTGEFMEWFDANRELLEEEYPEQSAEELLRTARVEFKKLNMKTTNDSANDNEQLHVDAEKENDIVPTKPSVAASSDRAKSAFAHKASKRLSSFKFATTDENDQST